ncbi:MAG: hypothetical protein KJS97_06130 [Alphaproteobacteria bacterium]|nr:hypothetical protein [Alphaproteobacteria bacterium]
MGKWIGLYVIAFLALTGADMASTHWATAAGQGQEFNAVVATEDGALHTDRFLLVNGLFLAFSVAMLAWAFPRRAKIDPRYIERPSRALFNYFYLNPFSKKIAPKSVFHFLALAPAVLLMKAFAAFNNSLIAAGAPDIVTPLAKAVFGLGASELLTYWTVIIVIFHPIWYLALVATARLLRGTPAAATPQPAAV